MSLEKVTLSRITASLDSIKVFVDEADASLNDTDTKNLHGFLNAIVAEASFIVQLTTPEPQSFDPQEPGGGVSLYGGGDK